MPASVHVCMHACVHRVLRYLHSVCIFQGPLQISDLPGEVLQRIFGFLDGDSIGATRAVCKCWSLTIDDAPWEEFQEVQYRSDLQ